MAKLTERVSYLERLMEKLAYAHLETQMSVKALSEEMKQFKDEMREFKDEMRKFKDEMKEFKDEMKDFKDEMKEFKDEMREFKDEMKEFKDEMRKFKDEVEDFKDWTKQNIREMNKRWGELANKMGTIVEDIVAPAFPIVLKKYFGCDPDDLSVRRRRRNSKDRNKVREFDVVVLCDGKVFLNETKATPKMEYAERFVKFLKSGEFFEYFPEYRGMDLLGVFSSLNLPEEVIEYLSENGVYAMGMRGEYMDILNFDKIR